MKTYTCPNCGKTFNSPPFSKTTVNTHEAQCKTLLIQKANKRKNMLIQQQQDTILKLQPTAVDIIIPCHNYGKYLTDCLKSLDLNNTKHTITVLVVDDSSDLSLPNNDIPAIVDSFNKTINNTNLVNYIRVEHGSPNETRKTGYLATSSPFIVFLDADDELGPNYVDLSLAALIDNEAHIAHTAIDEFVDQGNSTRYWEPPKKHSSRLDFCHVGCMIRRSLIDEKRPFDLPNDYPCEDFEFWRRLCVDYTTNTLDPDVKFVNCSATYHYRKHNNSRFTNVPRPYELSNKVIGVYFTEAPDPQRPSNTPKDDINLVKTWVESALKQRLRPVVICDHETPNLKHTYPDVEFIYQPAQPIFDNGVVSGFYYRWKVVEKYLQLMVDRNKDAVNYKGHNVKTVFITDLFDVQFNNNPFRCITKNYDLYLGSEFCKIKHCHWLKHHTNLIYKDPKDAHYVTKFAEQLVLNAGIVGGWIGHVKRLASALAEDIELNYTDPTITDMVSLNNLVYNAVANNEITVFTGKPLHSKFKGYETDRNDLCIIHK